MENTNRELVVYQNEDAEENVYKDCILTLLEKWIKYNQEHDKYVDGLTLCRDILKVFDSDCEFYADDVQWDTIREYMKEYEEANGHKFK